MDKGKLDKAGKLALQRLMTGHFVEKIPDDCTKSVVYVMQGDGLYERRRNKLGVFVTRIAAIDIPGLDDAMEEGWELNVPPIPVSLLGSVVAFFRKVYKMHRSEAFVQIFYDTATEEYVMECPKQTVSGASVKFERNPDFETPSRVFVLEIHSHAGMGAFFSGTDDRDEKEDRFYGVVGKVDEHFPQMKLRLIVGGRVRDVDVDDLFDTDEEMYHKETFPDDWPTRIEKRKEEKKGKKWRRDKRTARGQEDLVVYSGRQAELFGEDALGTPYDQNAEMEALYEKYLSGDYLASSYENFMEDGDEVVTKDGQELVKKDGKYWHVTRGKNGEMWTEVNRDEVSNKLYGDLRSRLAKDPDDWTADDVLDEHDREQHELDEHNRRCEEWLRNVEKEEWGCGQLSGGHPVPAVDAPDYPVFPHEADWRNRRF